MPTVTLEDLEIRFPYDPYEIQKNLMGCVIKCIRNREHGLLESPTGTGKTASLLCSSLAWLQNEKDCVRRALQGSANAGFHAKGMEDPTTLNFMTLSRVPKIIYATRTHSQIGQAMRELKRTAYNKIKTVVLGSRDIMCIHDEVSRLQESSTKIMACHMKVLGRTCAYYNNVQKTREQFMIGDQPVMDIEELVSKGKNQRFCPFFMSKELVADADLIFMPYNYLLDPKLRASHGVELKGCIIILDEAHNITKVCEDSSSFELKSSIIAQCIREITRALNEFNELTEELKKTATKDLSMGEIVNLKAAMLELEKHLDTAPFSLDIPDNGKTIRGEEVLKCFFASGFTIDQFGRWIKVLDGISSFLAGNGTEASGCDKFAAVLRVLSTRLLGCDPSLFLNSYAVRVEIETTKQGQLSLMSSLKRPSGKIFSFWCLNPAVGLDLLLQHNPRCIMLASGTLSPIDFLENELQLHFPVKIQNPHIITEKQLYAAVVKVGPGNVKLSSAFANRSKTEYLVSLGNVIRDACSIVPEGVLVFFPSYSAMDQAVEYWKENGGWDTIASQKSVYVEPRGKRALDELITNYYRDAARGFGSCLMAVCRGKVSEGLDFTDGKCRAVVITGLPYAPFKNEQVVSKMKYLDSKANNSQGIRGSTWYSIDAVRALNQAIGRIIRHRNDFGAILLCDDRCDYRDVNQNLSTWVKSRLIRPSYSEMTDHLQKFFQLYGISTSSYTFKTQSSYSQSTNRPSSSQNAMGSGFQFNSQTGKYTARGVKEEIPIVKEAPEPKFSELYEGGDVDYEDDGSSRSLRKSGASALFNLEATTSPTVSFNATRVSKTSKLPSASSSFTSTNSQSTQSSNPKKKIKLISENREPTKYSRIAERYPNAQKSGVTLQHVMSTSARQAPVTAPKMPVFKPLFSSTPAVVDAESTVVKSFENVKEFAEWMKKSLNADQYRKVMEQFKDYKQKNDVKKLVNFGKTIFPQRAGYKSYLNGIRLVTSPADRAFVNDAISNSEK